MAKIEFADLLEVQIEDRRPLRFLGEAGYLCLARGEFDPAERIFEGLTHLVPEDPVGHLGLAELHLARTEPEKAEAAARRASEVSGNSPETMALAYELRGMSLNQMDRHEEAERVLREAIDVAPDSHSASNAKALTELFRETRARENEEQGQ